jgi:hypothetical protein
MKADILTGRGSQVVRQTERKGDRNIYITAGKEYSDRQTAGKGRWSDRHS